MSPRLPVGAAGALVYRFGVPGDSSTWAVQVEAVNGAGERLTGWRFWNGTEWATREPNPKRPSSTGSRFAGGRAVFVGRPAASAGAGVVVCEGPVDALALAAMMPGGAAVLGVAGTSGFKVEAVAAWPAAVVTISPDGDEAGDAAAVRMAVALQRAGRPWRIRRPGARDRDWCDVLQAKGGGR